MELTGREFGDGTSLYGCKGGLDSFREVRSIHDLGDTSCSSVVVCPKQAGLDGLLTRHGSS